MNTMSLTLPIRSRLSAWSERLAARVVEWLLSHVSAQQVVARVLLSDPINDVLRDAAKAEIADRVIDAEDVDGLDSYLDRVVEHRVESALNDFSLRANDVDGLGDAVTELIDVEEIASSVKEEINFEQIVREVIEDRISLDDIAEQVTREVVKEITRRLGRQS